VLERDGNSGSEPRSIDKASGGEWSWGFLVVQALRWRSCTTCTRIWWNIWGIGCGAVGKTILERVRGSWGSI